MLSRIALNSQAGCTRGHRTEMHYHTGIESMGNTASYKVPVHFLLHILCLASSKHIRYFQKQIWGSVYGLFFHSASSINSNESIGIFQVSHQPSFSNLARTECVTCVKGFITHYLCTELQNSARQLSPSKPEWELLLIFTRRGFGIPEAKFPQCRYANLMCSEPHMKSVKDLSTVTAQHKHSPPRHVGGRVCSSLASLKNS